MPPSRTAAKKRLHSRPRIVIGMNIGMRLAAIVVFSIVWHYPAAALTVCSDRNAAITMAELNMRALELLVNGEGEVWEREKKAAPYEQRAAQIAKAHCVRVDNYPPQQRNAPIKFGCRVFSGEARVSGGELKTVYWTSCPQAKE